MVSDGTTTLRLVHSDAAPPEEPAERFRRGAVPGECLMGCDRRTRGRFGLADWNGYSEHPMCWRCWAGGSRCVMCLAPTGRGELDVLGTVS